MPAQPSCAPPIESVAYAPASSMPRRHRGKSALRWTVVGLATGLLAACMPGPPPPDRITLKQVSFDDLPDWGADRHSDALPVLAKSCGALLKLAPETKVGGGEAEQTAGAWSAACRALPSVPKNDPGAARAFFERWFTPYRAANHGDTTGLFTGYYEPLLRGARQRGGRFTIPLYFRPPDLVTVDLGRFHQALKGERVAGKVVEGRLVPYASRADIDAGALAGRRLELLWVDDAVDAFFLHIQGSGRVRLQDGTTIRVGYAGANGRPYTSIGRVLVQRGEITLEEASMPTIRAWLAANPERGRDIMAQNASYVFFRKLDGDGSLGAQGVELTAGRSLAVDRRFVPLGTPIWLDTTDPLAPKNALRRLMIAQDTGGAIRGPVRGDFFWGHGNRAAAAAGVMRQRGGYFLLLPRLTAAKK